MREERYRDTNGRAETRQLSLWERVIYITMLLLSGVAMVSMLVTLITPYINPEYSSILPLFGLLAPAIFVANIALALYWIIRWEWRVVISMLSVLLIGVGHFSLFVKMPLTKEYNTESYRGMTKVMSYNIRRFKDDDNITVEAPIMEYIESVAADIVCLQEFYNYELGVWEQSAPKISRYNIARHADLAILSRYPILNIQSIVTPNDHEVLGASMSVDVVIGRDTVRVINNHLQSTTITKSDNEYLTSSKVVRDNRRKDRLIDITSRFRRNGIARAIQADSVAKVIAESPYPVIVCGDLNDTPSSYSYTTMARGLSDSFREQGRGYSHTFRGFFNSLRIDYILCSEERITPKSYMVDETITYSDHLPVIVHLQIVDDTKQQK